VSLTELLASIQSLPRSEKLRLIQLLAADIASEDAPQGSPPPRSGLAPGDLSKSEDSSRYPLRGTQVQYENPTESVAQSEWETLK